MKKEQIKIAVYARHFDVTLADISEAVGYEVHSSQIVTIPAEIPFPAARLEGCNELVFVGACKVETSDGLTMAIPFSEIEERARAYNLTRIYRLSSGWPEGTPNVRNGSRYQIRDINLLPQ